MMFGNCYQLEQRDKSSTILVCGTCCLVLQSTEAIVHEDFIYQIGEKRQRDILQADFRNPAQWRHAQFVLHMPDHKGVVVEGSMIELDDFEAWVQVANFNGLWFWKGKFLDVYRSGDEVFANFDDAADHALKALLYWHDRL